MICLHQTVAQGKKEPCGIEGSQDLAFALQLVRRGYVCIAPDMIGFGERIPAGTQPYHDSTAFYKKYPNWSFMGKMVRDARRAVDVLVQTKGVDPKRLGAIGHSLGAEEALMLAAFDERIGATVASCGYATFAAETNRLRWARARAQESKRRTTGAHQQVRIAWLWRMASKSKGSLEKRRIELRRLGTSRRSISFSALKNSICRRNSFSVQQVK
jgi:dienelactone hydrolase